MHDSSREIVEKGAATANDDSPDINWVEDKQSEKCSDFYGTSNAPFRRPILAVRF